MTASNDWLADLQAELDFVATQGLRRKRRLIKSPQQPLLQTEHGELLSFCNNDYLGLANHPALIAALQSAAAEAGVGAGASHLITGHHQFHHEAELALAAHVKLPRALLFSTGYMANMGVISALLGRHDAIFADKLNHASLNDAAVLSRADLHRYAHNDLPALEALLAASKAKRKLIVVDAVFSMDGDLAPVPELLALCEQYDAWLMLDDAHGFGVLGQSGGGILEYFKLHSPRIIYMATLGKAAGVFGAFVAGESVLIDYLVQNARTSIYTTAMPPSLAAAVMASLNIIRQETQRRIHLQQLIARLREGLRCQHWQLMDSSTAIQPLLIGDNQQTLDVSAYLQAKGILVPAIRPPTVPKDTARLRISLSSAHSMQQVDLLIDAIHAAEKAMTS